mgnify:FL=1
MRFRRFLRSGPREHLVLAVGSHPRRGNVPRRRTRYSAAPTCCLTRRPVRTAPIHCLCCQFARFRLSPLPRMDAAKLAAAMRSTGTFYGTPEGAGALCPAWLQSDPDDDASGTLRHYLRLQEVTREFYRGAIDEDEHRRRCHSHCRARAADRAPQPSRPREPARPLFARASQAAAGGAARGPPRAPRRDEARAGCAN